MTGLCVGAAVLVLVSVIAVARAAAVLDRHIEGMRQAPLVRDLAATQEQAGRLAGTVQAAGEQATRARRAVSALRDDVREAASMLGALNRAWKDVRGLGEDLRLLPHALGLRPGLPETRKTDVDAVGVVDSYRAAHRG